MLVRGALQGAPFFFVWNLGHGDCTGSEPGIGYIALNDQHPIIPAAPPMSIATQQTHC